MLQIFASHAEDNVDAAAIVKAVTVKRQETEGEQAAVAGDKQENGYVCRASFDSNKVIAYCSTSQVALF
jgi:hypothetical protein